jgi:hypothetical protein
MKLLDAVLAFALTLAALATVVSVFIEAGMRAARMRRRNLLATMKLLSEELATGALNLSDQECWDCVTATLVNPTRNKSRALAEKLRGQAPTSAFAALAIGPSQKGLGLTRAVNLVEQTCGFGVFQVLYSNVSLEHVMRRIAELPSVRERALQARDEVKAELNRLARKYEEFGSAASANFKRHAQAWSIGAGIVFALIANVDGLRIFEAYRADAELAAAVIANQQQLVQDQAQFRERRAGFDDAQAALTKAGDDVARLETELAALDAADATPSPDERNELTQALQQARLELQRAGDALDDFTSLEAIRETATQAAEQLASLKADGIPLGWHFYPACPYGQPTDRWQRSDRYCRAVSPAARVDGCWRDDCDAPAIAALTTLHRDFPGFARWLFAILLTGVLIGLGAPFWFDVAKRLAHLRSAAREAGASAEERMSGADANGDDHKRRQIVDRAVDDAIVESLQPAADPPAGKRGEVARRVADAALAGGSSPTAAAGVSTSAPAPIAPGGS